MQLGTQTASLINHLYSNSNNPIPNVGMGATFLAWTDRTAGTVISVENGIVSVQEDNFLRTDSNGMSDAQSYEHSPNPNGFVRHYRFSKRKEKWEEVSLNTNTGRWIKNGDQGIIFGRRDRYYDYSF